MKPHEVTEARRQLHKDNKNYTDSLVKLSSGVMKPGMLSFWRSNRLLVQVYQESNDVIRLSVNRTDIDKNGNWKQGISWDELQAAKNAVGYGDKFAVEVFPADEDLVNVTNMRHLWVLPEPPPYVWRKKKD